MNEFDDERTIDEEETMTQEDEAEELNALKDEQDMPIEELLKMYGYNKDAAKDPAEAGPSETGGAAEDTELDPEDDEEEDEDGDEEEKAEGEKVQQDEEKEEKGDELVTQVWYKLTHQYQYLFCDLIMFGSKVTKRVCRVRKGVQDRRLLPKSPDQSWQSKTSNLFKHFM